MVTPLELSMSSLCLFLGFSASASRATGLAAPLLSDLYTAAMAVDEYVVNRRNGNPGWDDVLLSPSQGGKKSGHMQKRVRGGRGRAGGAADAEGRQETRQGRRIVQKNVETGSTRQHRQHRQQLATCA